MSDGFLYVVCGAERFFGEAYDSVRSLKCHNPGAHATLVCDALPASLPQLSTAFDGVVTQPIEPTMAPKIVPKRPAATYRTRNIYAHSPYDRTCFLDSDTHLLADVRPLFDLLDYFDMAMALAPADVTPTRVNGKDLIGCTPYNCGVILFKKCELTERLFDRWRYWHEQALGNPEFTGSDQGTFMRALLDVPCRICALQSTWNARTPAYERLSGPVRLIHGRHPDVETIARNINITSDLRVWIPQANVCLYERMSAGHLLKYWIKATWLSWRRSLRRLLPIARR